MRRVVVLAVVLVVVCILPAVAQVRTGQERVVEENGLVDLSSPALALQIEAMRAEIKANGWTFQVGINPAMRYPLDRLCGRREELLPPEVLAREYGVASGPEMAKPRPTPTPTPPPSGGPYVGIFTPPKDQGNCGSCWAFGTIDEAETAVIRSVAPTDKGYVDDNGQVHASLYDIDLSEQYVLSCNTLGYGCNGGNDALGMLVGDPGAILDSCFTYRASKVACAPRCTTPRYPLSDWGYAQGGSDTTIPSVGAIKAAIQTYGAVTAYVYADNTFQAYTGGVYNNSRRYRYTNHQIQLVGWDDNALGTGQGAWLLKNSWGTNGWGIGGYMWITYTSCRVGEGAAWATYN